MTDEDDRRIMADWPTEPIYGFRRWHVQYGRLRAIALNSFWESGVNKSQCLGENIVLNIPTAEEYRTIIRGAMFFDVNDPRLAPYITRSCVSDGSVLAGHQYPLKSSNCGFWAHKLPIKPCGCATPENPIHGATGVIRMWGHAVEHEHGWRSEFAEVVALVDFTNSVRREYNVPRYRTMAELMHEWAPDAKTYSPTSDSRWEHSGTFASLRWNALPSHQRAFSPPLPVPLMPPTPAIPPMMKELKSRLSRWFPGVSRPEKERRKKGKN